MILDVGIHVLCFFYPFTHPWIFTQLQPFTYETTSALIHQSQPIGFLYYHPIIGSYLRVQSEEARAQLS